MMNELRFRLTPHLLLLLFALLQGACAHCPAQSSIATSHAVFDEQVSAIAEAPGLGVTRQRAQISALYDELIVPYLVKDPSVLSDNELRDHAQALLTASFFQESRALDPLHKVVREMKKRRMELQREPETVYHLFVEHRRFAEARVWLAENPQLNVSFVPVSDPSALAQGEPGWRLYVPESGSPRLVLERAALSELEVVILSSPGCHFSRRAFTDLQSDAKYQEVQGCVWWVGPAGEDLRRWVRSKHPPTEPDQAATANVGVAYTTGDWRFPLLASLPTFYFYQNGVERYRFSGWPQEGNWEEWRRGLCAIGRSSDGCDGSPVELAPQ